MNEFLRQSLEHYNTLTMQQQGDCHLVGLAPDLTLYVEEIFGEEDDLSRSAVKLDGTLLRCADDADGTTDLNKIFTVPQNLVCPASVHHTRALNFIKGRHRGLREEERIAEVVHPLSIQEKMAFVRFMGLNMMPPQILGLVESAVLAEAVWEAPNLYLICRRLRIAYALTPQTDARGQKYDYDTVTLHLAYVHATSEDEPPWDNLLAQVQALWAGVTLHRPMDCLIHQDYILIADGGDETRYSTVHIWTRE